MGRELLVREPVFRHSVELCDEAIQKEAGWSVLGLLQAEASDALLEQVDYLQPALTTVMIALAALWRSWGVEPNAVLGFSIGEAAAAHVVGMLDLQDTMAVVCRCARLLKRLPGSGAILSNLLAFAPENSDAAAYSAQLEPLLDELRAELAGLKPQKGFIPMASTVDDKYIAGPEMNADYWVRNLRQTVLRMNGIRTLLQDGYTTFLEVSPCPVAWNALRETFRHFGADATAVASLRHAEGAQEALCKAAGALYAQGISPDWAAMFRAEDRRFVPLPTYCWEDKPCWFKATQEDRAVPAATLASSAPAAPKADSRTQFLDQLKSLPSAQRRQFLLEHLQRMVGQILGGRDSEVVDCSAPLRELGLTSLMTMELAAEIELTLQQTCSAMLVFNYPTIEKITDYFLAEGIADALPISEVVSAPEAVLGSSISEMPPIISAVQESVFGSSIQSWRAGSDCRYRPWLSLSRRCQP